MKKDESNNKDRMMNALLQEDAKGGADEGFLSQLESAIDGADEKGEDESARQTSVAPWAWGLAAAACVGGVVGYALFVEKEGGERQDDYQAASGSPEWMQEYEAPRKDLSPPLASAPAREQGKAPSEAPANPAAPGVAPQVAQLDPSHADPYSPIGDLTVREKTPLREHLDQRAPTSRVPAPAVIAGITDHSAVTKNSIDGTLRRKLGNETQFGTTVRGTRVGRAEFDALQEKKGNAAVTNADLGGLRGNAVAGKDELQRQQLSRRVTQMESQLTANVKQAEQLRKQAESRWFAYRTDKAAGRPSRADDNARALEKRAESLLSKNAQLRAERERLRKNLAEHPRRDAPPVDRERYGQLVDQPWNTPWQTPLSTFSVDVDTAAYTNIRRLLRTGGAIPKDAVRTEECINYFDYAYPKPQEGPFAVHVDMASCPWKADHHLVKIGLKGREVDSNTRPSSNLVFLIDVSGSMNRPNKLPLLVESMKILVEELDERDSVGIVVYAGSAGTILEPTKVVANGRTEILSALDHLRAGGSTAGAAGIRGAYELAAKNFRKGGVNRVILATDGDFNVGTSSTGELVDMVKERAKSGVYLSVLGFGTGNINDAMMEAITNDGNGNYFYIDSQREGRKVFLQNLSGTLVTIAKDVKIQVEFNPGKVAAYRLIGYANRILPPEAFNDDKVDAGDIGAGHTVTALYEIVPKGVEPPKIGGVDGLKYQKPAKRAPVDSPEWMTVKLRYKAPDGDKSSLLEIPVKNEPEDWTTASCDFQMAAAVALFGEKLRQSDKIDDAAWELVQDLARKGAKEDRHGHRAEFLELVSLAGRIPQTLEPEVNTALPIPAVEAPKAR